MWMERLVMMVLCIVVCVSASEASLQAIKPPLCNQDRLQITSISLLRVTSDGETWLVAQVVLGWQAPPTIEVAPFDPDTNKLGPTIFTAAAGSNYQNEPFDIRSDIYGNSTLLWWFYTDVGKNVSLNIVISTNTTDWSKSTHFNRLVGSTGKYAQASLYQNQSNCPPGVVFGGKSTWAIVWLSTVDGTNDFAARNIIGSWTSDYGKTWNDFVVESSVSQISNFPTIAYSNGVWLVSWINANSSVQFRTTEDFITWNSHAALAEDDVTLYEIGIFGMRNGWGLFRFTHTTTVLSSVADHNLTYWISGGSIAIPPGVQWNFASDVSFSILYEDLRVTEMVFLGVGWTGSSGIQVFFNFSGYDNSNWMNSEDITARSIISIASNRKGSWMVATGSSGVGSLCKPIPVYPFVPPGVPCFPDPPSMAGFSICWQGKWTYLEDLIELSNSLNITDFLFTTVGAMAISNGGNVLFSNVNATLGTDLFVQASTLELSNSLVTVGGNLTISGGSTLVLSLDKPLQIHGCANIGNDTTIKLSDSNTNTTVGNSITLASFSSSSTCQTPNIEKYTTVQGSCAKVYTQRSQLLVLFVESDSCQSTTTPPTTTPPTTTPPTTTPTTPTGSSTTSTQTTSSPDSSGTNSGTNSGNNPIDNSQVSGNQNFVVPTIIAVVCVVVVGIILAIVFYKVPRLRKMVTPFRNKSRHTINKSAFRDVTSTTSNTAD